MVMTGLVIDDLNGLRAEVAEQDMRYARLALAAVRLDARADWALDGSLSMRAWLRHHCRMTDTAIGDLLRYGRFLARSTPFAHAAVTGRLSRGQVTVMRQAVTTETEALFDDHAEALVEILEPLELRDAIAAAQVWKARAEAVVDKPPRVEAPAELSFGVDDQGQAVGRFTLSPAGTLDLEKALGIAGHHDGASDTRTAAERRAQALEDVCAFFNANHDRSGTPRHRPHTEIVREADGVVRTIDGRVLDTDCAQMLLCDCVMHRVLKAGSTILDYGRATRSVPYPTFRALAIRDGGCRFPGCGRPVAWTDAHHIVHWEHGGSTELPNLCLFCRRHHRRIHRAGWSLQLLRDGTVVVTIPTGEILTSSPRGSPVDTLFRELLPA